jgi:hypothetical protein
MKNLLLSFNTPIIRLKTFPKYSNIHSVSYSFVHMKQVLKTYLSVKGKGRKKINRKIFGLERRKAARLLIADVCLPL